MRLVTHTVWEDTCGNTEKSSLLNVCIHPQVHWVPTLSSLPLPPCIASISFSSYTWLYVTMKSYNKKWGRHGICFFKFGLNSISWLVLFLIRDSKPLLYRIINEKCTLILIDFEVFSFSYSSFHTLAWLFFSIVLWVLFSSVWRIPSSVFCSGGLVTSNPFSFPSPSVVTDSAAG